MLRIMLLSAVFIVSPPSRQEVAIPSLSPVTGTPNETAPDGQAPTDAVSAERGTPDAAQAAQGPIPEPVSVVGTLAPVSPTDSAAGAEGRRTLSTAFVRMGPDGFLTVELRDGRVLVLRDIVMRRKDYCGMHMISGQPAVKHCGRYADVAAARPGDAAASGAAADPIATGSKLISSK